eukprot:CAMPEP_0198664506 /NCGR_PEP_ID=MMETSP1467-20131203/56519_1 /TAXON_ID=1462469 /ORGANISM="unid. sp., Strain CCMP2135" /LENGTH=39 /DNA_ID= /DNA_START= /DNA_END= /DNA_ORIENTATION=
MTMNCAVCDGRVCEPDIEPCFDLDTRENLPAPALHISFA